MHWLMTAATTRNDGDFAFHWSVCTIDKVRVIVDLHEVRVSELDTLQLLKYNIFGFINEFFIPSTSSSVLMYLRRF